MLIGDLKIPTIAVRGNTLKDAWEYAQHSVIDGKPRTQPIAPSSRQQQLDLFVHAEWMQPQETVDRLRAIASAYEVVVIQADSGLIYGQFVLVGVDITPRWMLPDETIVSAGVTVTLVEAGLESLADASPSAAVVGSEVDTTDEVAPEDMTADPNDPYARWP
jgi:phage protein U